MPAVRKSKRSSDIVAVCCADIHLSAKPPIARACEPDWYTAMRRPMEEVLAVAELYAVPLLIAGDVFDKWNSPASLINFAIDVFQEHSAVDCFSIAGQHDLPLHSYADIKSSAYWTLVAAGCIKNMSVGGFLSLEGGLDVVGFPYPGADFNQTRLDVLDVPGWNIALLHKYAYIDDRHYKGAAVDGDARKSNKFFQSFRTTIIGDNHIPWDLRLGTEFPSFVFNCGAMMRRSSDQCDFKPSFGIVRGDGSVERRYLYPSEDVFEPVPQDATAPDGKGIEEFLAELRELHGTTLDYAEQLRRAIDGVTGKAKKYLIESLEQEEKG